METWVLAYTNGTGAVAKDRHSLRKRKPIVSHGSNHPNELGAATSSSYILGFCGTKGYSTLFAGRPRNKGRTNKLAGARSRLAINLTPAKVSVRESAEQEGGGS